MKYGKKKTSKKARGRKGYQKKGRGKGKSISSSYRMSRGGLKL